MRYRFDQFEIDTDSFELLREGRPCAVEPKVFDLIAHLAAHPQQVLSVDQLVAAVWHGRIVSDTTVSTSIKNARKALGDSGESQRCIKTVRGRGYRFEANVETIAAPSPPPLPASHPPPPPAQPAAAGRTPGLLLLPLRSGRDEADAEDLGAALLDGLAAILTRIPLLRIGRHANRDADPVAPGARTLYEERGVDYLLDGSVQRVTDGFRIHVQLVDARTGFQLWASRFDVAGPLQEALVHAPIAVVGKLEPQLHRAIYDTVRFDGGRTGARQLFLEAASVLALKGWLRQSFGRAAELLRKSVAHDPDFALSSAFLALVVGLGQRIGLMHDPAQARSESLAAAEHALALDSMDSTVLGYVGCALADIGQRQRALPILRNAIDINPANAQAWAALGTACVLEGQLEDGVRHLAHGIAISPLDNRLSFWGAGLTVGLLYLGRIDEALAEGRLACQRDDRCCFPRVALAAVHLVRGDPDAARRALDEALRIDMELSDDQIAAVVGPRLAPQLIALRQR